jgi:catechol 2,3-dioxygenase-like lactoylglutathione lyase family enzyme
MQKVTLDHLNLVVADMESAIAFYGGLLGMHQTLDVILEGEWIDTVTGLSGTKARCVFFELENCPVRLELLQYFSPVGETTSNGIPNTTGWRHIAFNIDDMDAWVNRLEGAGLEFVSPPVAVPFPVGGRTKRLCYFRDLENNLLELAEYR